MTLLLYNCLTEIHQEDGSRLFLKVHKMSESKKCKGHKCKHRILQSCTRKTKNYQEGGQALVQDAQRKCAISILGNVQDLPGHSLEQPGLVRSVLRWLEVPSNLNDYSNYSLVSLCPKVTLILPSCSRSDTDQQGSCINNNLDVPSKNTEL